MECLIRELPVGKPRYAGFPWSEPRKARVSDTPLPAEVGGYVCLWQTLAHSRNAHI